MRLNLFDLHAGALQGVGAEGLSRKVKPPFSVHLHPQTKKTVTPFRGAKSNIRQPDKKEGRLFA